MCDVGCIWKLLLNFGSSKIVLGISNHEVCKPPTYLQESIRLDGLYS